MKMFRVLREALLLGFVAFVPATISWARWQANKTDLAPYEIAVEDPRLFGQEVLWLDARARTDYKTGHIIGALPLNVEEWDSLLGSVFEVWRPGKSIVVYCNAGCQSSEKIAERLRNMGVEPVYYLRGGYEAWKRTR